MEHSRLLKFLTEERHKTIMAEPPSFKIKKEYENPPNISAEVPGEQEIRESDSNCENTADTNISTSSEGTDTKYTLSPVITVTKNETTLTKGDMKLQKVTVTEDIAAQEIENGGYRVSYEELQTSMEIDKQTVRQTVSATERELDSEEMIHEPKKSRIPQKTFRQTVEKVQKDIQEQTAKDQPENSHRRSSIPKLKDPKAVKRKTSLKVEEKVDDEFDRIYEEIVENKQNDVDEKILAVKIDDPEKVESKFDEIIHAYDSNDDSYLTHTEKLRLSKIPFRRKDNAENRTGSVEKDKTKKSVVNSNLKDGGFRVSATTIKTKRFSRGNSTDLNKSQKLDVVEPRNDAQNPKDKEVIEEIITPEDVEGKPKKTTITVRTINQTLSPGKTDDIEIIKKVEESQKNNEDFFEIDDFEVSRKFTKEKITRIPIKPERINRSISRELNRRPAKLDDRDYVNREVHKYEEFHDGTSKTTINKESENRTEKVTRSISRSFSRDGRSITVSSKSKVANNDENKTASKEAPSKENNESDMAKSISSQDQELKENVTKIRKATQLPTPVFTKTTHSYSKGRIQTVERSKSIEWKSSEEVITNKYARSYSEKPNAKQDIAHQKDEVIVTEKGITQSKIVDIGTENIDRHVLNDVDTTKIVLSEDHDVIVNSNNIEISEGITEDPLKITMKVLSHKEINNNDSIATQSKHSVVVKDSVLKGNVSRLISQISVNESSDVPKKVNIDVKEDMPKKKTVLSKIAMFEGKEPTEFTIKIKKYILDNAATLPKTEIIEEKIGPVHTPVIVDQIWKFQEEDISSMHQVVDVKVLPEAFDFTVSEIKVENTETWSDEQETNTPVDKTSSTEIPVILNEHRLEHNRLFPETVDSISYEKYTQDTQSLPAQINFDTNRNSSERVTTLPANVNFISNKNNSTIVKFSAEKTFTENKKNKDKQPELEKPKVGKLNFDLWNKQVEVNKQLVGKGKHIKPNESKITIPKNINTKIIKTEISQIEVPKTPEVILPQEIDEQIYTQNQEEELFLPSKADITVDSSKLEEPGSLPKKIRIKSEGYYEMPTILPAKSEFTSSVSLNELPNESPRRINFARSEGKLHEPVVLPETPLTKSPKLNFEFNRIRGDVPPSFLSRTPANTPEISSIIPRPNYFTINSNAEVSKTIIGEISTQLEDKKTTSAATTINTYNKSDNRYENNQAKTDASSLETPRMLLEKNDFNSNINSVECARLSPSLDVNNFEKEINNTKYIDDLDIEIPSDPELVDSEPEIKDSRSTIMGRLKNKLYLITNRNINRNKTALLNEKSLETSTDEYTNEDEFDPVFDNKSVQSNYDLVKNAQDDNKSRKDFNIKTNIVQKSIYDFEVERNEYKSREDMKRTVSLAELDLGDAVKGQVQRMVYRIKSVDFGKLESSTSTKISPREMPKKSSVLEKIALFEEKSINTRASPTTQKLITTSPKTKENVLTTPPKTQQNLITTSPRTRDNVVRTSPRKPAEEESQPQTPTEEFYLRKMEELSKAKLNYNKTDTLFLQLGNGEQMPAIALGTALLDPRLAPHIVAAAIDLGYRAIDTAYVYGTEKVVGQGIKMKIDDGTVARKDLFIANKLWSTFHKPELVEPACRASLTALGLEYFDLFMLHNPISLKEGGDAIPQIANVLQFSEYDYLDAWFAMESLVSKGLVKALGVSNFNSQQIQRIIDKGHIKPMVNQVECHPYLAQKQLHNFCAERNIVLSCFSCLGSKGTPAAYKTGLEPCIDDPLIKVMASGLNVTPAQLLVRYQIQSGRQAVVKASSPSHLWDNLQALTFILKPDHITALNALDKNMRNFDMKMFGELHKNYPFNVPF